MEVMDWNVDLKPPKMDGENFMVPNSMNKWDDLGG